MSKENELLFKLDFYINETTSVYCDSLISVNQILTLVFAHIDIKTVKMIFLRGSRATGRNNGYSDVDLLVIVKEGDFNNITIKDDIGVRYNMQIHSSLKEIEANSRFFYGLKAIYDTEGKAEDIVSNINNIEKDKCKNLSIDFKDSMQYLDRLVEYIGSDDIFISSYFKAKYIKEFPAFLSVFNGYELLGYKHTIDCLLRDDCDLAMSFAKVMEKESTQKDAINLKEKAFNNYCAFNPLNIDFTSSKKLFDIRVNDKTMYESYETYSHFIDYIRLLRNSDQTEIEFLKACKKEYPEVYKRIWQLIH